MILSNLILPLIVLFTVGYGFLKKIDLYDAFVEGAKESFDMVFTMFPCVLGMILGINLFLESGILNNIMDLLNPLFSFFKIPKEIFPISIMRPISGSASLALLNNIFTNHGPDSLIGRIASVIQGSTETTFYVITLYFGCIGIKKIRYALKVGLLADLIGIIASIVVVNIIF